MPLDRFLVYGRELYRKVRDSLAGAILSENMDELVASVEVLFLILLSSCNNPKAPTYSYPA